MKTLKKVSGFRGTLEILGKERGAAFDTNPDGVGTLQLSGLSIDEADTILGTLAGRVRVETLPTAHEPETAPPAEAAPKKGAAKKTATPPAEPPKAEKPAKAVNGANGAAKPAAPKKSAAAAPPPPPADEEDESEFEVDDGDEDEPELAEADAEGDDGDGPTPVEDLVQYLTKRTKLQPIIFDLLDSGYRSVDALVEACEKLKAKVPVLTRVPNFKERIPTALEAYGVDDPSTYDPDNRAEFDQSERLF